MKREVWLALDAETRRSYANPRRRCAEPECEEPAGTPWSPYWCARHDDERLARITRQFDDVVDEFARRRSERG